MVGLKRWVRIGWFEEVGVERLVWSEIGFFDFLISDSSRYDSE